MCCTRRSFLAAGTLLGTIGIGRIDAAFGLPSSQRRYHVCLSPEALDSDAELLEVVASSGVNAVWVAGYFYGHWPFAPEAIRRSLERITAKGIETGVVNIPLGHPGDSLGSRDGNFPLTPPKDWRPGMRSDGSTYAGTSLHEPATAQNASALIRLRREGASHFFLDDDFRLATGPGIIGGCFCEKHRARFLLKGGYAPHRWDELLANVRERSLTPLLRDWVSFTCDELSQSFRIQRGAEDGCLDLGIMVMYLGAEKAGIRLEDYAATPMRVGELMFDDGSFGTAKGKTDELYSALFHRRYVIPQQAYSETTAYPATALSARNLAAKLAVSTMADVRNTMFMSGLTPFPRSHWDVLAPAMRRHAAIHQRVAGHIPRGPLKHFWGEASRLVGDDRPFSLPLALGIPFEVTNAPACEGWTFLSDADAVEARAGRLRSEGTVFLTRAAADDSVRGVAETFEQLRVWKGSIANELACVPHLEGNAEAVLAWYPTARAAVLWNLHEERRTYVLREGESRRLVEVEGLGIELIEGVSSV